LPLVCGLLGRASSSSKPAAAANLAKRAETRRPEAEDETMEDMLSVTSVRAVPPLAAITASRHAMTSSSVRVLE